MSIKKYTAGAERIKPRKVGDAPAIGNVQMVSAEKTTLRRRRSASPKQKKKITHRSFAWSVLAIFFVISVLIIAIVRNVRNKVLIPLAANQTEKPIDLDKVFEDAENSDSTDLKSDEAIKIVTQALANRDPALIHDFFILGEGENPVEVMEDLIRIRETEGEITQTEWLALKFPSDSNARQVIVHSAREEIEQTRRAQLIRGSDGKWRIDLHAYLRKCDPSLKEIISAQSGTFIVRMFIAEESSYRGIYSDRSQWRAYSLASPDINDALYAYAKRGSSQDKALRSILLTHENFHHSTLSIVKQANSEPRQFEISRVIAANWIIGEEDFDKSF